MDYRHSEGESVGSPETSLRRGGPSEGTGGVDFVGEGGEGTVNGMISKVESGI